MYTIFFAVVFSWQPLHIRIPAVNKMCHENWDWSWWVSHTYYILYWHSTPNICIHTYCIIYLYSCCVRRCFWLRWPTDFTHSRPHPHAWSNECSLWLLHKLAGRGGPFKGGFPPDTTNKTHNAGRTRKWLVFTKVEHTVLCIESESIVANNMVPTVAGLVAEL